MLKKRQGYVVDGVGHIPLTKGQIALVDPEMMEELCQYNWHAWWNKRTESYYARYSFWSDPKTRGQIWMHRLVAKPPSDRDVDHEDHNTLDNRRLNLRIATEPENSANARINRRNTTGYKGVTFNKQTGKFMARIGVAGKVYLGLHETVELAHQAYMKAAEQLYGEFAYSGERHESGKA